MPTLPVASRAPTAETPVVVAVGATGSESALRFGAAEAARIGCPIHLVHVVSLGTPTGSISAESVLRRAVAFVEATSPTVTSVGSEVFHGTVDGGLLAAGRCARMLVVQNDERKPATGLAAAAYVPIVLVPAGWPDCEPVVGVAPR